jgi:penicillin-binding protein 1A
MVTIRDALTYSRNLATINMVSDMGFRKVVNGLHQFGIVEDLPENLSLALGTISLSPHDLAKYYTMFAAAGVQTNPILIRRVVTPKGETFQYENTHRQVETREQIYKMTSMLQDVVAFGTGKEARVYGVEIAGKTGTTNKNIDAWFAGYSPTIETIVWYGNDNNTPMRKNETGGRAAGSVFRYFMEDLFRIYPKTKRYFDRPLATPSSGKSVTVDENGTESTSEDSSPSDASQEASPSEEKAPL